MNARETGNARNSLRFLTAILLACCSCVFIPSCSKPPANRTVVIYTSADQQYAEEIFNEFQKQHPDLLVLPRYDTEATKTTGLVERLRAERRHPQADVFWSNEPFLTQKLAREGLFKEWTSEATKGWPAPFCDPEHRWYGFAARARVVAFDPSRVSDPPKFWSDLADPRFKGRIVMADPNYGTTRGQVATWFTVWGAEKATQFLRGLKANDVRIVQGNSQAVRNVAEGLADLALTDTDDVWAAQRNGYKIELVYPSHGEGPGMGTLLIPNTVSLVAGRPDNSDAAMLAEFLLSEWCQMRLRESDSHNIPLLPLARLDQIAADVRYVVPNPLAPDVARITEQMDTAMRAVDTILLGR